MAAYALVATLAGGQTHASDEKGKRARRTLMHILAENASSKTPIAVYNDEVIKEVDNSQHMSAT
eukprot:1724183-Karenia_brevis.AAC.1